MARVKINPRTRELEFDQGLLGPITSGIGPGSLYEPTDTQAVKRRSPMPEARGAAPTPSRGQRAETITEAIETDVPETPSGFFQGLAAVFGAADDPKLTPEENQQIRQQALMAAGMQIMALAGRTGMDRVSFIEAIAGGAMAGQMVSAQERERLKQAEAQARTAQLFEEGQTREALAEAIESDDMETARVLAQVLGYDAQTLRAHETAAAAKREREGTMALNNAKAQLLRPGMTAEEFEAEWPVLRQQLQEAGYADAAEELIAFAQTKRALFGESAAMAEVTRRGRNMQVIEVEGSLADDFRQETRVDFEVARAITGALSATETGIGDQTLIVALQKLIDPGSVVRESEFARAFSAQGILDRLAGMVKKAQEGRISPELRAAIEEEVMALAKAHSKFFTPTYRRWERRVRSAGSRLDMSADEIDAWLPNVIQDPYRTLRQTIGTVGTSAIDALGGGQ